MTRPQAIRALAWTGVLLALAGVWSLYTQPGFLVDLADRVWSCF